MLELYCLTCKRETFHTQDRRISVYWCLNCQSNNYSSGGESDNELKRIRDLSNKLKKESAFS